MIEIWLGDPNSRDPVPLPHDPEGVHMIMQERLVSMDEPDGRMLVYVATEIGEGVLGNA